MKERNGHNHNARLPGAFEVRELPQDHQELSPEEIAARLNLMGIDANALNTTGQLTQAAIRIGVNPDLLTG